MTTRVRKKVVGNKVVGKKVMGAMVAFALLFASGTAAAQAQSNEVSVFGSWDDVDEPVDAEVMSLHLRYGRFVSPRVVAMGTLSRQSFEASGVDSTTTSLHVGAKYYFGEVRAQAVVPFAEASIGFANTDTGPNDSTDLSWEFGGGAALMIDERTSIDGSVRFYNTDTDTRTKGLRLFLGLTTRF